jgi:hypothetical protein
MYRYLQQAKDHMKANLGILQKHRRKMILLNMFKALQEVSVLRTARQHVVNLLQAQQFKPAIEVHMFTVGVDRQCF